jgi:AraC-like DNA-binding protein
MIRLTMLRMRQSSDPPAGREPSDARDREASVLGYAVTHRSGSVVLPQAPGWDQLLFAASGVMTVETAVGVWVVPPHRAVWVPAGVEHRLVMSGRVQLRSLYLSKSLTGGTGPTGRIGLPRVCRVVNVAPLLRELVLHTVKVQPLFADDAAHVRLAGVLVDLLAPLPDVPLQLPLPVDGRARDVAAALTREPGSDASVDELARAAGTSRRTVERLFAAETGMSVGAWRQRLRLVEALRLLAAGEPTSRVALAVGYSTPSAFGAMFRRVMGTTPGAYFARQGTNASSGALS